MKKSKLNLSALQVSSFSTSRGHTFRGGRWSVGADGCPHTGDYSLDGIGCNSLDDFYCEAQSYGSCQYDCDGSEE